MIKHLKKIALGLITAMLCGCTSGNGGISPDISDSLPLTSEVTTPTAEKTTAPIETTTEKTTAVPAEKKELTGYDGKALPFGKANLSQLPYITFPVSFGYYDGEIIRMAGSSYRYGMSTSNERYVVYKGEDGEYQDVSGGYSINDVVLYGTLKFDVPYMSSETTDMMFAVNMAEDDSIPFPYYDNAVQEELLINLGAYEDNPLLSELIADKKSYDGAKLWLVFSELNIGWSDVIPNQSDGKVSEYKIDERMNAVALKKLDEPIQITLSHELDTKKLEEEIGYDLGVDLNEIFRFNDEYYYEKSIESIKETLSGDMLEDYEKRNYLEKMSIISCFLGLPEADWIICAGYSMYGVQGEDYARFFYVKDGEIVRELPPAAAWVSWMFYDNGELFVSRIDGGLYEMDLESGEMTHIIPDGWGIVSYFDEDYIVFGNSMQKLYIRETGELIETGVNWCGLDPLYTFRVKGERIEFIKTHAYGTEEEKYVYDITKRTLEKDDSLIFEQYEASTHRNSRYKALIYSCMKNDYMGSIDYGRTGAVKVIDLETDTAKVYNFENMGDLHCYYFYIDGDWLWLNDRYAVNLLTDEIAKSSLSVDYSLNPEYRTAALWDYESDLYATYKNYYAEIIYPY